MYTSKVYKDSDRLRIELSGSNTIILPHADSIKQQSCALGTKRNNAVWCATHALVFGHSVSEKIL